MSENPRPLMTLWLFLIAVAAMSISIALERIAMDIHFIEQALARAFPAGHP